MKFEKAKKSNAKLRLALQGPSGGGKTYTALAIAKGLGGRVALIDTENQSASKYADVFDFDTLGLTYFSPANYVEALMAAAKAGYSTCIIDSLSHSWMGVGGALEMAEDAAKRSKSHNTFTAWKSVTPEYNRLINAIIQSPMHIIATMRSKEAHVVEANESGKSTPRKVGLEAIAGKGIGYEFDIVLDVDAGGECVVSKTRYSKLSGRVIRRPDDSLGVELGQWLSDGVAESSPVGKYLELASAMNSAPPGPELEAVAAKVKESSDELNPAEILKLRQMYAEKKGLSSGK